MKTLARSLALAGMLAGGGLASSANAHHHADHWGTDEPATAVNTMGDATGMSPPPPTVKTANGPAVGWVNRAGNPGLPDGTELVDADQLLELAERGQILSGRVSYREPNRYMFTYVPTPNGIRKTLYLQRPSGEEDRNLIRSLQSKNIYITQQTAGETMDPSLLQQQAQQSQNNSSLPWYSWMMLGGLIGMGGMYGVRAYRQSQGVGGADAVRQREQHNKVGNVLVEKPKTRLSDVKGHDEILEEVNEIVLAIKAMNWRKTRQDLQTLIDEGKKIDTENERIKGTFLEQTALASGRLQGSWRQKENINKKIAEIQSQFTQEEIDELDLVTNLMEEHSEEIPKGVVMYGPPGTGKTLIARAIAGEADASFFKIAGSEFVEMFVGTGAARVRDLFAQAKDKAKETGKPSIIFIDEIDAIGGARGRGGGGDSEREQTLNQILVEMDGFDKNDNIMVIFATNRLDMLDPALIRPGRIDSQIQVPRPDKKGRLDILKHYMKKRPTAPDVNLENMASMTRGFAGADLENLVKHAARNAIRERSKLITNKHLSDAFERVLLGVPKKRLTTWRSTKEKVAAHELGHGLAALACKIDIFVMSMISRDKSLGHVIKDPESRDEFMLDRQQILEDVLISAAGRAAERAIYGDNRASTGAAGDQENIERLYRMLRTTRLLDDGKRSDYSKPDRPLAAEDEKVLNEIIAEAERVGMELVKMVPSAQYQAMIQDSLKAGTLIQDAANQFFLEHLKGYDWEKAYKLVEGFVQNPTGVLPAKSKRIQPRRSLRWFRKST